MKFNAGNTIGKFQKIGGLHGNGKEDFVKFKYFGAIFKIQWNKRLVDLYLVNGRPQVDLLIYN